MKSQQIRTHIKQTLSSPKLKFAIKPIRNFTSNSNKWNSNSNPNLKIKHPTLILLESCNSMSQAKQIQAHMTHNGLIFHMFPISRLITFIALDKNGDIAYARDLFSEIIDPNVYIWNTIIRGYVKRGFFDVGFGYFVRMVRENVEMDERSYVFGLKACEGLMDFRVGECVYCRVWKVGFVEDVIVRNGLIHFYCERGKSSCARRVFDECEVRDVFTWTSMIDGNVKNGKFDEALEVFKAMCESGVEPNDVTMVAVFSGCAQKGDLRVGESIHEFAMRRKVEFSLNMMNSMLDMYIKCGGLDKAKEIFEKMKFKDVFSWTTMIDGYAKNGAVELAKELFDLMPKRNVVSWTAMIGGYSQNNRPNEALVLFHEMEKQGFVPIESTFVSVLSACAQSGFMDIGQRIREYYVDQKRVPFSVILRNAFIDMYGKCGDIDAAREIFDGMVSKNLVSYNTMISVYASHGYADKAISLFEHTVKVGLKPDDITFVGILSACAHSGLVEKGWGYFSDMELFGLTPKMEHYACMIDLLGRVGLLSEAYSLIKSMPMEPSVAIWGALLNGCKKHGNVELGEIAAEKLKTLDPRDSGTYVILGNLYANEAQWGDVRMARSMMRDKGISKIPGFSSIEVGGKFHDFFAGDESHPESKAIYTVLRKIFFFPKMDSFTLDHFDTFS